jgi:hypothetical protein
MAIRIFVDGPRKKVNVVKRKRKCEFFEVYILCSRENW